MMAYSYSEFKNQLSPTIERLEHERPSTAAPITASLNEMQPEVVTYYPRFLPIEPPCI